MKTPPSTHQLAAALALSFLFCFGCKATKQTIPEATPELNRAAAVLSPKPLPPAIASAFSPASPAPQPTSPPPAPPEEAEAKQDGKETKPSSPLPRDHSKPTLQPQHSKSNEKHPICQFHNQEGCITPGTSHGLMTLD